MLTFKFMINYLLFHCAIERDIEWREKETEREKERQMKREREKERGRKMREQSGKPEK